MTMHRLLDPSEGAAINLGSAAAAGLQKIHDNSAAVSTVVTTTLPHGLVTGDHVWFASSDSDAVIDGDRHIVRVDDTSFTLLPAVDCHSGAGSNVTTMQHVILEQHQGRGLGRNDRAPHGLRSGDTVTITGSNSTVSIDGASSGYGPDGSHLQRADRHVWRCLCRYGRRADQGHLLPRCPEPRRCGQGWRGRHNLDHRRGNALGKGGHPGLLRRQRTGSTSPTPWSPHPAPSSSLS